MSSNLSPITKVLTQCWSWATQWNTEGFHYYSQTDVGKQDNLFGAEDSGINGMVASQNDLANWKQKKSKYSNFKT